MALFLELLCEALPIGALVLDSEGRLVFANREAVSLLARWNLGGQGQALKAGVASSVPVDVISACHRLRSGSGRRKRRTGRPDFGGRILVKHPTVPHLSAVVGLWRSSRDRRLAAFCVLLQDGFKSSLSAGSREQLALLSIAERQVAKLVADGFRNSEIAQALGKSLGTVKSQLQSIFSKLNVETRTQLVTLLRLAAG